MKHTSTTSSYAVTEHVQPRTIRDVVTVAEFLRPRRLDRGLMYDFCLILGGSLLIAVCARIAIPVGFSPIPITGQTFAVLLVGAVLGSGRGALAVVAYLVEGAAGVPVGAGGMAGVAWLVGPTGGYLVGFVAAAFVTGCLAERGWDRSPWRAAAAMTIGTAVIFAFGLAWLSRFPLPGNVLAAGLWPYVPGALIKIALAAALLPAGWKIMLLGGRGQT